MSQAHSFLSLCLREGGRSLRGDVEIDGHEGKIDIETWSWDVSVVDNQAHPSLIKLSKIPDPASTAMMQALAQGTIFETALLEIFRDETLKGNSEDLIEYRLSKVRLVSYELTVRDAEKNITMQESWTLDYDKVGVRFGTDGLFVDIQNFGPPVRPETGDKAGQKEGLGEALGRDAFLQGSGLVGKPGT